MANHILQFLERITDNQYLIVFILSALPIIEMKGAILVAEGMRLNPFWSVAVCWLGSSMVAAFVLCLLKPLLTALKKTKRLARMADKAERSIALKTQKQKMTLEKADGKKYLMLMLFVAVPIPFTGVWTGSAIAALSGWDSFKSGAAIAGGNLFSTILVSVIAHFGANQLSLLISIFIGCAAFSLMYAVFRAAKKTEKNLPPS